MLNATIRTLIRRAASAAVGAVVSAAAMLGIDLDGDTQAALFGVAFFAVTVGYEATVEALEKRWPALGWLLGAPRPAAEVPVRMRLVLDHEHMETELARVRARFLPDLPGLNGHRPSVSWAVDEQPRPDA